MTEKKKTINSRAKGVRGEREVRTLIESMTGFRLVRNTEQSEKGGYDLKVDLTLLKTQEEKRLALRFDEFAFEIKNTADGYQPAYMKQCQDQAAKYSRTGVLLYKIPLKGFRVAMHARDLIRIMDPDDDKDYGEAEVLHMLPITFFKLYDLYNPVIGDKNEKAVGSVCTD